MQIWNCSGCNHTLYFDNTHCLRCGATLGFMADIMRMDAIVLDGSVWRQLNAATGSGYRFCSNHDHAVCNWMVPADDQAALCLACGLNRTIPNLANDVHRKLWAKLESEKRRLVYALLRLGLPVVNKQISPAQGLAFDFLADTRTDFREGSGVVIGHADGVITLDIAEADDAVREQMRQQMAEPYRTILGHFRHESGHYYWDRLVRDSHWLASVRGRFGDETEDYGNALQRHYKAGPPRDWQQHHVTAYASSHPWEDWAESWAHYLHMVDTLETAWQFGMRVQPQVEASADMSLEQIQNPYRECDFGTLRDAWLPLTYALNNLNRSMGQPDAYPFVLSPTAIDKLALVHEITHSPS